MSGTATRVWTRHSLLFTGLPACFLAACSSGASQPDASGNVEVPLEITEAEGKAGVEKSVLIPATGKTLKIQVPRNIQTNTRLRLRGEGAKGANGNPGDVYLRIRIRN
jgi:hypothetical protein